METGLGVFDRFTASQAQTLWYYQSLVRLFTERHTAPAPALIRVLEAVQEAAACLLPAAKLA